MFEISAIWSATILLALVQRAEISLGARAGLSVLSRAALGGWERAGAIAKARRERMYVDFIVK